MPLFVKVCSLLPPPVNISQHFGLPNNCARIGSLLSAPAACYMHAPAPEPQGVDLRAPAEAPLGRGALCSFIASVKKMESQRPRRPGARFFFSHTPPPHFSWGACRTSANIKMGKMEFAELLQTSKWRKWRLQNFCKCQNGENGACRTSANIKMGKMEFAELLQTSKWRKWRLQNFCKRQNGENGACRTSANVKMEKVVLAELLQTPTYSWLCNTQHLKPRIYA